tara:strand:- start:363 stop:533 length:171 start_codon:yes stop_codon:yes gene_type:complete
MSRRVYVPSKAGADLNEAAKLLYLLKTALATESKEQIDERIDKIRSLIVEAATKLP